MAEATTTEITVTPKQLGRHLRSIRRKKGLSLSEVARGAGLSRRELVAYERGKVPIPESDLWVLAGSCGVDVAELLPSASTKELAAAPAPAPSTIGDAVTQLRRNQEDAGITPYLHTLQKLQALQPGKRIPVKERELDAIATALGATPRSIEEKLQEVLQVSPAEAERLRAMILVPPSTRGKPRALAAAPSSAPAYTPVTAPEPAPPAAPEPFAFEPAPSTAEAAASDELFQTFPAAPAAFLDAPLDAPIDSAHGLNVDVFEELARLPEPLPLGDPSAPVPDLLAPQDPFGALPVVGAPTGPPEGAVELVDTAMVAAGRAAAPMDLAPWSAADAPPIDVAMRAGGSATWHLGEPPLAVPATPDAADWTPPAWEPPAPEGAPAAPAGFWEGTDDWTPDAPADAAHIEVVGETAVAAEAFVDPLPLGEDTWAGSAWDPSPWTSADQTGAPATGLLDDHGWGGTDWADDDATDRGAWDHTPDPAAVDSGFFVDWGTPDTDGPPAAASVADAPVEVADPVHAELEEVVEDPADDTLVVEAPGVDDAAWAATFGRLTTARGDHGDEVVEDRAPEDTPVFAAPDETTSEVWDHFATTEGELVDETPSTGDLLTDTFETGTDETGPFGTFETGTFELRSVLEAYGISHATMEEAAGPDTVEPIDRWAVFEAAPTTETDTPSVQDETTYDADTFVDTDTTFETFETDTVAATLVDADGTDVTFDLVESTQLAPISWRAESAPDEVAPDEVAPDEVAPDEVAERETAAVAVATVVVEHVLPAADVAGFVAAGPDWQLGNALPLVEVQGQGGLIMRRADERWALADVTTAPEFVVEVDVDFRSGPGFGVLFLASVDDEGRMSGYSFDIDPIYDGGGYLVRQWQADRELWNPIARFGGTDPAAMYGSLTVRLELAGERLTADVNGVEVLAVESLVQASAERGRDAAAGDRVGVQAWSSSDLVIANLRVAAR